MKNQAAKKLQLHKISTLKETFLLEQGYSRIIGIDEVGRGSWAGPVVLGAYIFTKSTRIIPNVNDSKTLSTKDREFINQQIPQTEYELFTGEVSEINNIGVGRTLERLIRSVINSYSNPQTYFIIDGYFKNIRGKNIELIIKGDAQHYAIACASIVAKVYRDNLMKNLASTFQGYSFDKNVGYGTKVHRKALLELGVTEVHRTSYKPINRLINGIKFVDGE